MHRYLQGAAVAALAMAAFPAAAQVVGSVDGRAPAAGAADAPTIVLQDQRPAARSYHFGEAVDSGSSTFRREAVEDQAPGSGDANEVLKALPTVQFSSTQGEASRAELQDLRPENISISGGSIYENLFVLDGVGVNSRLDVSNDVASHYIEGNAAASAQTVWVDANLIGEIVVRDSNVSAEYGQFTGGVVEMATRRPGSVFGVETHYGETSPSLAQFRMSDKVRDALNGVYPDQPDYMKRRYGVAVDLPLNDRIRTLWAYTRSEAEVTNYRGANWVQYGDYGQKSLSQTLMVKAEADLKDDLLLTGQVTWSPYESEFSHPNGIDNWVFLNGGGLTGRVGLEGRRGEAEWTLDLTHAWSNNDRDSERPGTVNVSTTAGIDWCSGTSCSLGGPGILWQEQNDTTLKGRWTQPLGVGRLRAGFEIANISAEKGQPYSAAFRHVSSTAAQLRIEVGPQTVCLDPAEAAAGTCVTGAYALAQRNDTTAFDTQVDLQSYSLWGEYDFDWAGFMVRAGLRYDYESFLENHNFAPRLSVSRDLPLAGMNLTGGLNRYFGRSFLGYALRENYPGNRIYRRTPTVVNGQNVWANEWTLYSHSETARYSSADLDTPYTDEFTVALRGPIAWIGGEYRIKGIVRESRDQFASSESTSEVYDVETGGTSTRRVYTVTNDGERSYRGLSLEYVREFGRNHALSFSTNWSHTDATNISYFDISDETEFEGEYVYYQGEVVPKLRALADNQLLDFASPLIVNGVWSARWLDGRLRTNVNARWRDGFSRVDDTLVNITVNGVRYDVYDKVEYKASVDVNLAATFELAKTRYGAAALDLRVNNLFNSVLNQEYSTASQPYQLGRNLWVGLKYRY